MGLDGQKSTTAVETLKTAVPEKATLAEKKPELAFKDSSLGKLVEGAQKTKEEEKKRPGTLKKRIDARKTKPAGAAPDKKDLEDSADKLAAGAKKIEVTKDADGKETVKIAFDAGKLDPSVFTPDVKGFSIKMNSGPEGARKVEEKNVERAMVDGVIGYFTKGASGKRVQLKLPKEVTDAEITIKSEDRENWTEDQVLEAMKVEAKEAQKVVQQKAAEVAKRRPVADLAGLTDVSGGSSSVGSRGGRSSGAESSPAVGPSVSRGGSVDRTYAQTPSVAPLPSPVMSGGLGGSVDLKNLPEVIKGPLDEPGETITGDASPLFVEKNGKQRRLPLYLNISKRAELKSKPVELFCYFPQDGGSAKPSAEMLADVEALRRAGHNIVLAIPEHDASHEKMAPRWDYLGKNGVFDKMIDFCFEKSGQSSGQVNLIAFSGGCNAVVAGLNSTSDKSRIHSISMLDSTFDARGVPDAIAEYVQGGGKVRAVTGPDKGTRAGAKAIQDRLAKLSDVKGTFKPTDTNLHHGAVNAQYLASAMGFAAGVVPEAKAVAESDPSVAKDVDTYLTNLLYDLTAKTPKRHSKKGHCNYYAADFANFMHTKLFGTGTSYGDSIAQAPLASAETAELRGKPLAQFTVDDCHKLRPGQIVFANSTRPYHGDRALIPGTSNILPSSNALASGDRHWLVFVGFGSSGEPIFTDNGNSRYSLDYFKAHYGGKGRVVVNVHDPLAEYRDRMTVADGRLVLDGNRAIA